MKTMLAQERICILYGSQTGTAQDVAELIWRQSKKFNLKGPVMAMDDYSVRDLITESLVIFVCSTTGQGDEPDNMKSFWRFLLRKNLPLSSLSALNFAVLGFGDSSYTKYNYSAKRLYKRLVQLSATPILPLGLCDDQHEFGPAATYITWMQDLWNVLCSKYKVSNNLDVDDLQFKWQSVICEDECNVSRNILEWPLKQSANALIVKENRRVTAEDHFQDVRLLSFDCGSLKWQPGDVLSVRPWNSDEDVDNIFALLEESSVAFGRQTVVKFVQTEPEMLLPVYYRSPITLELAAKYTWNLKAIPRQRVLELLCMNCKDEMEKEKLWEMSQAQGLEDMINYIIRPKRTILEVLYDFPHAVSALTIPVLFELFEDIKPRFFSIASIPQTGALEILVAIVDYKTKLSTSRKGLCTSWLKTLNPGDTILGSVQPGSMKMPRNEDVPIVMVGPGTGVAPFRSVLLQKEYLTQKSDKLFLFFGCRNKLKDFYFKEDFERLEGKGLLCCFVAFSRDQHEKRYVQHLIEENSSKLKRTIIEEKAVILVAGSSKNMPNQVKSAFRTMLGNEYLQKMIKEGMYQEETWS